jgi:hypothetical protein
VRAEIEAMDGVFGVLLPGGRGGRLSPHEQALFDERQEARRTRDFARADAARARLEGLGVLLEDTPKRHALAAEGVSGASPKRERARRPGKRARTWRAPTWRGSACG